MADRATDPLRVPDGFWDGYEVQRAVRGRDIGDLLTLVRRRTGAGQTRIGAAVGLSQGTVSDIMRGKRRVLSAEVLARVATGLDMPSEARASLGLAPDSSARGLSKQVRPTLASGETWGDTSWVLRRTVLAALATMGTGVIPVPSSSQLLADVPLASEDDWQEVVWEYGYAYLTQPRTDLLAELVPDLHAVLALVVATADERKAASLAGVAARLAGLVAMACTDLQWPREARHAWRVARRMASCSRDPSIELWVYGNEITLGIYQGRPLPVVIKLADRATALGHGDAYPGRAELLAGKAQAMAMLGQRTDAISSLQQAEHVLTRLPEAITSETDSIFGWPERRLRHAESFVFARVGRPAEADRACDQALTLYSLSRVISRAQIQMHRAMSLVKRRDVAGGIDLASMTLKSMPPEKRRQFVLAVASNLLEAVPASEVNRPRALEYRNLVRELAAGS